MDNRHLNQLSRLRTSDLLTTKMNTTKKITYLDVTKKALIGLFGIFVTQIAKTYFGSDTMGVEELIAAIFSVYTGLGFIIVVAIESSNIATKEMICDVLEIRKSNTGKRLTKRRTESRNKGEAP